MQFFCPLVSFLLPDPLVVVAHQVNPLDMTGPAFLGFYIGAAMLATLAAIGLRWYLRLPAPGPAQLEPSLSPYEVAYLAGGEERAVMAALARLVADGVMEVDQRKFEFRVRDSSQAAQLSDFEEKVMQSTAGNSHWTPAMVAQRAGSALRTTRKKLEDLALIVDDNRSRAVQLIPPLIIVSVALFGFAKVMLGLSRGRPVAFLIVLITFTLILAAFFLRAAHRSRRGDSFLESLKLRNAALEYTAVRRADNLAGSDVALSLGLFGPIILANSHFARLHVTLRRQHVKKMSDGSSSSSGWSSSCGSSSCSGGGGCGGGCGGGGCGGCGS